MALHFGGFQDDRYWAKSARYRRAVEIFGPPDMLHRRWDVRAFQEIAPGDKVVWANNAPEDMARQMPPYLVYTFDDSDRDVITNGGRDAPLAKD